MKYRRVGSNTLLILVAFVSLGALFGGSILMISPDGTLFGMPLSMLDQSPFTDFFLPGLVLFLSLGVFPVLVFWGLFAQPKILFFDKLNAFPDMHWAWAFAFYNSIILIAWIQVETFFLQSVHWAHLLYILVSVSMLILLSTRSVRIRYSKKITAISGNDKSSDN